MAVHQYRRAIEYFSRLPSPAYSPTVHDVDAHIEFVCAMLEQECPAAHVLRVAEDGCPFDEQPLGDGWLLLVRVLVEVVDADSATEQAAQEENQHTVNKLLSLLSSNVSSRRERDARMLRCLQEGGDQAMERRATAPRRLRSTDHDSSDDVVQLRNFYETTQESERDDLLRVPLSQMAEEVANLVSRRARQEPAVRDESKHAENAEAVDAVNPPVILELHARMVEPSVSASSTDQPFLAGEQLSDALCDLRHFAESATAAASDGTFAQLVLHSPPSPPLLPCCPAALLPYFPAALLPCCPGALPPCRPAALPPCRPAAMPPCRLAAMPPCRHAAMPLSCRHAAALLPCCPAALPPCRPAALPPCRPAAMPPCRLAVMPPCRHAAMPLSCRHAAILPCLLAPCAPHMPLARRAVRSNI